MRGSCSKKDVIKNIDVNRLLKYLYIVIIRQSVLNCVAVATKKKAI